MKKENQNYYKGVLMKNYLMIIVLIGLSSSWIICAPRDNPKPLRHSCTNVRKEVRAETEKIKPLSAQDRDQQMFMGFLGIVVNFVKLFLDPQNIPEAKQNALSILNGVYNLAHVITRRPLMLEMQNKLVEAIIELCKENQLIIS